MTLNLDFKVTVYYLGQFIDALDVLCAQLTRDLFAIAKFLSTIARLMLHCLYSLDRPVKIGTPMVIFAVLTVF